jgi:hypothetical protein
MEPGAEKKLFPYGKTQLFTVEICWGTINTLELALPATAAGLFTTHRYLSGDLIDEAVMESSDYTC